jgi:nitroreductase
VDIIEAIYTRRSVRAFKPDPVPLEVLEAIMEATLQAPSWENTQPWEFAVVGGNVMRELKDAVRAMRMAGEKPGLDIPWPKYSGQYLERAKKDGRRLFQELGISKSDPAASKRWRMDMSQFFDAPSAVVLYMERTLSEWSLLDSGLALQNLMLASWNYGVGTCALAAGVIYPDLIRSLLNIPQSKRVILGVAVGYPDFSSPVSGFKSSREPMDQLVTWHGFEEKSPVRRDTSGG